VSVEYHRYGTEEFKQSHERLEQSELEAQASLPLNREESRRWRALLLAEREKLGTEARFANGRALPSQLWRVESGASYLRRHEDGNVFSGSFLFGSASDRPFHSAREFTAQGNLWWKVPAASGPDDAWVYGLNFSNNRSFLNYVPLPGVAYSFRASSQVRLVLGLPFVAGFWTPSPRWVIFASYFPVYAAQARVSYFLFGPAQIYLQAKYHGQNHALAERSDRRERLFYEEGNAAIGLALPVGRSLLADLSGSYAFDRKFFLARKSRDRRSAPLLRPDHAANISLKVSAAF
jgi:hypothetical protein